MATAVARSGTSMASITSPTSTPGPRSRFWGQQAMVDRPELAVDPPVSLDPPQGRVPPRSGFPCLSLSPRVSRSKLWEIGLKNNPASKANEALRVLT